jgi:hypothetical protein
MEQPEKESETAYLEWGWPVVPCTRLRCGDFGCQEATAEAFPSRRTGLVGAIPFSMKVSQDRRLSTPASAQ